METCVGCGSPLAPSWKFCVHCGIAVEQPQQQPQSPVSARTPSSPTPNNRLRNRLLLLGGIGIFLIGIALLVVAITLFTGNLR